MISARTAKEVHRDILFDALLRKGCFGVDPQIRDIQARMHRLEEAQILDMQAIHRLDESRDDADLLPDVERHEAQIRDMQACIHRLGESRNDVDLLPDVKKHETQIRDMQACIHRDDEDLGRLETQIRDMQAHIRRLDAWMGQIHQAQAQQGTKQDERDAILEHVYSVVKRQGAQVVRLSARVGQTHDAQVQQGAVHDKQDAVLKRLGSEVARLSEETVSLKRTSTPNSDAPQAASHARHEEHEADRMRLGSKRDHLPPGLIFFTAPPVMLFSMLCLVMLSFMCLSHVLSHAQTPDSPWGAPGGPSGGRSASHTASTVERSHAVRGHADESHVWTLGSLWETPECLSGGERTAFHAAPADRGFNFSAYLSVPAGSDARTDFTDPMESGARESAFKFIPDLWVTENGRDGGGEVESSQRVAPVTRKHLCYRPETNSFSY